MSRWRSAYQSAANNRKRSELTGWPYQPARQPFGFAHGSHFPDRGRCRSPSNRATGSPASPGEPDEFRQPTCASPLMTSTSRSTRPVVRSCGPTRCDDQRDVTDDVVLLLRRHQGVVTPNAPEQCVGQGLAWPWPVVEAILALPRCGWPPRPTPACAVPVSYNTVSSPVDLTSRPTTPASPPTSGPTTPNRNC